MTKYQRVVSDRLLQTADWAFVVVVAVAYLSLLFQTDVIFTPGRVALLLGLGLIYTLIGTYVFETRIYDGSHRATLAYFAVQWLLAASILWLGQLAGAMWLLLLPLVSHGMVLLDHGGGVVISALVLLTFGGLVSIGNGWRVGVSAMLSFAPGVVFIALFTHMAESESRARDEVERLAGDLQDAYDALARYAVQAEELATEKERTRLAREIHDSLSHYLTAINMQLEVARAVQGDDTMQVRMILDRAQALTKEGLQEVRRSVAMLRTSPLEGRSLTVLIEALLDACRAADIEARLDVAGDPRPLAPQIDLALYRAAQEALTNVRKHAQARHVGVTLTYTPEAVALQVQDDGIGAAGHESGFGLVGLRERVHLLGGEFHMTSEPGQGLALHVRFTGE